MRASIVLATLLLAAACGDDGTSPPPTGPIGVRVDRYGFDLDLTTRLSTATLSLHVLAGGDCVTLPSRATMLDLATVTLGGAPAVATTDGTTFTACGAGWATDTDLELVVHATQPYATWGASQVGFSTKLDEQGQPVTYLVSWVQGCDRFGPCDPNPAAFAHYQLTIHHPTETRVLCSGSIAATADITTCTFDYDGGPTYSTFGFIASPRWTETALGDWDGVAVTLFDGAVGSVRTRLDTANHAGFMAWMQARFGRFPYGAALRIVTAPTYWSGFEHPGNIVLDQRVWRPGSYARPLTHVLNHEIAHQWAGDQTTLASVDDFVWKESMAEYLSYVYEDELDNTVGLVTAKAWKAFAQGAAYFPVPEDEPKPALLDYYGEVYGPGPMILFRQVEALRSRTDVLAAIRMLLGQQRTLSVADVQAALETTTGLDLDGYVDTWIRGSGAPVWPTFRVEVTGTVPNQHLVVTETTPGGVLHGCNFAIGIGDGSNTGIVPIARGVDGLASVTVPTGVAWEVTQTELDPTAQCLAFPEAPALTVAPRHGAGWSPWTSR